MKTIEYKWNTHREQLKCYFSCLQTGWQGRDHMNGMLWIDPTEACSIRGAGTHSSAQTQDSDHLNQLSAWLISGLEQSGSFLSNQKCSGLGHLDTCYTSKHCPPGSSDTAGQAHGAPQTVGSFFAMAIHRPRKKTSNGFRFQSAESAPVWPISQWGSPSPCSTALRESALLHVVVLETNTAKTCLPVIYTWAMAVMQKRFKYII